METYTCYHCQHKNEVEELVGDDHFTCDQCEETNYVIGTATMDYDAYYEAVCDSQASVRYEEAAYGSDTDDDHFMASDTPRAFTDSKWDD